MSLESEALGPDTTRSGVTSSEAETNSASSEKKRKKRRRSRNRKRGKKSEQIQVPDGALSAATGQGAVDTAGAGASMQQAAKPAKAAEPAKTSKPKKHRERNTAGANTQSISSGGQPAKREKAGAGRRQNGNANSTVGRGIYSAIDLGTNNCRLLIARPTRSGFRVIDAFSRIVRLGEGVSATGALSEAAMDRTISALKVCAEKLARRNVTCMRHVATEACRVAGNADEFVARVKAETGINLDIITAGEEARLAVMGCQSLIAPGNHNALVFDIGGGSTELIWVRVRQGKASEIRGWMSIPWGVVNLSEKFGSPGGTLPADEYQQMVQTVGGHLQSFEDAHQISSVVKRKRTQLLGTSGTVTTLASLHLKLPRYIRDEVDGAWMQSRDVKALSRQVADMTYDERSAQPCIGPDRADLVVAGCAILDGILGMWDVPSLRVADRGIREGILRGLMETEAVPVRADHRYQAQRAKADSNKRHRTNG